MAAGPTRFVFVGTEILEKYKREWRAIERRYPCASVPPEGVSLAEHWETLAMLRQVAREELREAVRLAALDTADQGFANVYSIPV